METKAGLKNVLKNSAFIFSSTSIASIFGLTSTLILARYFGTEKYGIVALFQACVIIVRGFVNTQPWQAIIKYGVINLKLEQKKEFLNLAKITLLIEIFSAFLSGTVFILLLKFFNKFLGIPDVYINLGILYCFTAFLNYTGFFTGILRLFNKFNLISIHILISSIMRLIFIIAIWILKLSFIHSVYFLIIADIFHHVLFITFGIFVFNNKTKNNFFKLLTIRGGLKSSFKEVAKYLAPIWGWSTLRMLPRELDLLLVGSFLGLPSAGIYKITKQFASVLSRIYQPLYQAIFLDINIMNQNKDYKKLKKLLQQSTALIFLSSFILFLIFFVFGKNILLVIVGNSYSPAYWPTIIYLLACIISSFSITLLPFLFSIGYEKYVMKIYLMPAIIYFLIFPLFVMKFNISGASMAFVVFNLGITILITKKSLSILNRLAFKVENIYEKYTI